MTPIHYLPDFVSLQYSELMQQCIHPAPDGSNISFKSKRVGKKKYWYLYISLGVRRSEHYLGEESDALLARIENEKSLWQSTVDDRDMRARLVAMLLAGGATATPPIEGKVLSLLERSGVFLAGGVIVGTLAFRAYANMLGVVWHSELQTRDIDIATDHQFPIAVKPDNTIQLSEILLDSGMGFLEVPALNMKQPSTQFKIRGKELSVDVLTPMTGKTSSKPVQISSLNTFAQPVRFLDYLLDDVQPAVLLFKHGIFVNIPNPARFALHKLVVSQRRRVSDQEKIRRDLSQAEQLLSVLIDGRPGDLILALEACKNMGEKFLNQLQSGLNLIDQDIRNEINKIG